MNAFKVALITGASSGIGAGTAVHFASRFLGCKLSLTGRSETNLEKVVERCKKAGAKSEDILIVKGDVTNEEDMKTVVQSTIDHFKRLDILVNSAGIYKLGRVETTSLESYDEIMRVNVRSVFQLTKLAMPHLKETKGNIVNLSSVASTQSIPEIVAHCMSKAAIDQLTRCTALEVASDGVRVNAVNPSVIITPILEKIGWSDADYAKFLEKCKRIHALGRPGELHEVVEAIAFLADNNTSSFITGVTMPIDGGRLIMYPR